MTRERDTTPDAFHEAFERHNRALRQKTLIAAAAGLLAQAAAFELVGSAAWHDAIVDAMNCVITLNQQAEGLLSHTVAAVVRRRTP